MCILLKKCNDNYCGKIYKMQWTTVLIVILDVRQHKFGQSVMVFTKTTLSAHKEQSTLMF